MREYVVSSYFLKLNGKNMSKYSLDNRVYTHPLTPNLKSTIPSSLRFTFYRSVSDRFYGIPDLVASKQPCWFTIGEFRDWMGENAGVSTLKYAFQDNQAGSDGTTNPFVIEGLLKGRLYRPNRNKRKERLEFKIAMAVHEFLG